MTAPWVSRTVGWSARAGLGLARSVILLVVSVLYPAVFSLTAAFVWHLVTTAGHAQLGTVELVPVLTAAGVVVPSGPICGLLRLLVRWWTGVHLADGYRPASMVRMSTGFWWNGYRYRRSRSLSRVNRWISRRLRDPAAWRDRRALVAVPFGVGAVAALPVAGMVAGILMLTWIDTPVRLLGLLPLAVGITTAPYAWRVAVSVLIRLFRPSPAAALSRRVAQLTAQRADATAAQAAELRRIERDLHDGAQARLVALGLALSTAERAVDGDPERAKVLLGEARVATTTALRELRELVRGITPPVLSERGLADAVRALALDTPLPVSVQVEPGFGVGLDVPIESALYFGTAELLTNVVKHAQARRVDIRLFRQRGNVVIEVSDDGCGNAAPPATGGLAGLRRRLSVFDGTLSLDSPAGGPTLARMVVPWISS